MAWRNAVLAVLGAWFVVAAFVMDPMNSSSFVWSALILGGLTLVGAIWAVGDSVRRVWRHWLMALFGLYLALTPWLYGFSGYATAFWVTLLVGAAMLATALWQAM